MTAEMERQLLTVPEAAAVLGIGRSRAYEWAAAGRLVGTVRLGKSVRVHRATLERWLEEQAAHPHSLAYR